MTKVMLKLRYYKDLCEVDLFWTLDLLLCDGFLLVGEQTRGFQLASYGCFCPLFEFHKHFSASLYTSSLSMWHLRTKKIHPLKTVLKRKTQILTVIDLRMIIWSEVLCARLYGCTSKEIENKPIVCIWMINSGTLNVSMTKLSFLGSPSLKGDEFAKKELYLKLLNKVPNSSLICSNRDQIGPPWSRVLQLVVQQWHLQPLKKTSVSVTVMGRLFTFTLAAMVPASQTLLGT